MWSGRRSLPIEQKSGKGGSSLCSPPSQWPGQTSNGAFQLVWFLCVEGTFQFLMAAGWTSESCGTACSTNDYARILSNGQ